jgi:hypothetical protein
MVGLDVGVDDLRDLRLLERGELQVVFDVLGLGVYDRRRAMAYSAVDVGGAAGPGVEELLKDHGHLLACIAFQAASAGLSGRAWPACPLPSILGPDMR